MFATDIALYRIGDAYGIEYWRFLLPSEGVNFCHDLGYAEILLPSLIGYDGTISWNIDPDGPNGTGNPISSIRANSPPEPTKSQ